MQIKPKLDNYVLLKEQNKKTLLKKVNAAKKKNLLVVFEPASEDLLRFALEKTAVDMVVGMEKINPKDHTHYPRSGLDQVTCKIAALKGKTILFNLNDVSNSVNKGKLIARMRLNIRLCKKYKVKMLFTDFSTERTVADLTSFYRTIEKSS